MESCHDYLECRSLFGRVDIGRNTAAVIFDFRNPVGVNSNLYSLAVSRHRLVNRIVNNLVKYVVET